MEFIEQAAKEISKSFRVPYNDIIKKRTDKGLNAFFLWCFVVAKGTKYDRLMLQSFLKTTASALSVAILRGKRIVEDNPDVANKITNICRRLGFEVENIRKPLPSRGGNNARRIFNIRYSALDEIKYENAIKDANDFMAKEYPTRQISYKII